VSLNNDKHREHRITELPHEQLDTVDVHDRAFALTFCHGPDYA
jgi:hypothetical protein